jgi:hypothetical protein
MRPALLNSLRAPSVLERVGLIKPLRVVDRWDESEKVEEDKLAIGACASCSCDTPGTTGAAVYSPPCGVSQGGSDLWMPNTGFSPGCAPRSHDAKALDAEISPCLGGRAPLQVLFSDRVALPAATVTNVDVEPQAGCFFAVGWSIFVFDPTTGVGSMDWSFRRPRINGCPIACDDLDRLIQGAFAQYDFQKTPDCCIMPLRALLQRPSEEQPLRIPVSNDTAATTLNAQVKLYGFCCSTRICL